MNPLTSTPWPLRLSAFLFAPTACWQMWIFPNIPNYYLQHLFIYPAFVFMSWAWRRGLWDISCAWRIVRPLLPWLVALFVLQGAAHRQSAIRFSPQDASFLLSLTVSFAKLALQMLFVLFFALLGCVLMQKPETRRSLLQGALWTFGLLFGWCLVQAMFVYSIPVNRYPIPETDSPLVQGMRDVSRLLMETVSPFLEARWLVLVYDFYAQGAYALTTFRLNGFFEEASALASVVGVFFAPLGFGMLALGRSRKKYGLAGLMLLTACLIILIFCRSTTGQILAAAVLALTVATALRGRFRASTAVACAALCLGCLWAAFYAPHVPTYLVSRANYFNLSKMPRIICTLDTLDMIKAHPLLGVGRDWYFSHLHEARRYMEHLDDTELREWKKSGRGGELSTLPAMVSQYGLPATAAVFAAIGQLWLRLRRMAKKAPKDPALVFSSAAYTAWIILGFITLCGMFDPRNPLFCMPFFFFYALASGKCLSDRKKDET